VAFCKKNAAMGATLGAFDSCLLACKPPKAYSSSSGLRNKKILIHGRKGGKSGKMRSLRAFDPSLTIRTNAHKNFASQGRIWKAEVRKKKVKNEPHPKGKKEGKRKGGAYVATTKIQFKRFDTKN
jgi:hypothetical protein